MSGTEPAVLVAAAPALRPREPAQCAPAARALAHLTTGHFNLFLALWAVTLFIDGQGFSRLGSWHGDVGA